jgi:hypothetical protein
MISSANASVCSRLRRAAAAQVFRNPATYFIDPSKNLQR